MDLYKSLELEMLKLKSEQSRCLSSNSRIIQALRNWIIKGVWIEKNIKDVFNESSMRYGTCNSVEETVAGNESCSKKFVYNFGIDCKSNKKINNEVCLSVFIRVCLSMFKHSRKMKLVYSHYACSKTFEKSTRAILWKKCFLVENESFLF